MNANLPSEEKIERRGLRRRIFVLIWQTDTTPTRFSLALTASMLAISALLSDDCSYAGCNYLASIAPWPVWGGTWALYAALKWWRVFDGSNRVGLALFVNTVGSFLFCAMAIALTIARWPYFLLSAATVTMALASVWVLMRTGINSGLGFKGD